MEEVLFGIWKKIAQTNLSYELTMFAQHLKRKHRTEVAKLLGPVYKLDFLSYIFHCYATLPSQFIHHNTLLKSAKEISSSAVVYLCEAF